MSPPKGKLPPPKNGLPQKGGSPSGKRPEDFTVEGSLKQLLADQELDSPKGDIVPDFKGAAEIDAPLIRLVNCLISEAIKSGTSDIHIEPFEGFLRVRYRVDGVMQEAQKFPAKLVSAIVSRLKIMADLDICEKRIPQDGSIRFSANDLEADLRINTLPSVFGEKIVMRIMGKTNLNNDLAKLGIPPYQLKIIRDAIHRPDGLVLVTGPTGSGKTTTLYSALNELNDIGVSVFTAEDPVEGTIPGVTQSQVNSAVGYNFASILRALLRQDPDIILVGEIRDQETAEISIKAALTGHLVLSTLHTNCSVSTITRLLNIGIASYLIASSINCIVAQRLVRRICDQCKQPREIGPEVLISLGLDPKQFEGTTFYQGQGCTNCRNSGYKGRAPVYEVLSMSDTIRRMITIEAPKGELKKQARMDGMVTLRGAGLELVKNGITTLEEVLEVTNQDEEDMEGFVAAPIPQLVQVPATLPSPPIAQETQIIESTNIEQQQLNQTGINAMPLSKLMAELGANENAPPSTTSAQSNTQNDLKPKFKISAPIPGSGVTN